MSPPDRSERPPRRVAVLATAVLATGLAAAVAVVVGGAGQPFGSPVVAALLAVGFMAADRWPIYFEMRDEASIVTLSELGVTLGLFLVSPAALLLARVLGRVAADVGEQRDALPKFAVNHGLLLGETALALFVFGAVADGADVTAPRAWVAVVAALAAAACFDGVVLGLVLRVVSGRAGFDVAATATMLGTALTGGVVSLVVLLLVRLHPAAGLLMLAPAVAMVALHRANARLVNEGRRARGMHEIASGLARVPELDVALVALVTEARTATRTETARLTLTVDHLGPDNLVLVVDGSGPAMLPAGTQPDPAVVAALARWEAGARPVVEPTARGLVAPVHDGTEVLGALHVSGQRRGRGAFSPTDHTVLAGVAGQVATTAARARLRERLRAADAARAHLETHDALTGLGNRRWFLGALAAELTGGPDTTVTLVLINLKGFRALNEDLGHAACDRVLSSVAEHLARAVGDAGIVARLGSDEFVVAAPGVDDVAFRQRLLAASAVTVRLRGRHVEVRVAAGSAQWPRDATDVSDLLRRADLALDTARQLPHTAGVGFEPVMEEAALRRRALVDALAEALRDGAIDLVYQPVIDLPTRRVVGVEALARWEHPVLGRVRPDEFVAVAEEEGLVGDLTAHVLDVAFRQARRWADDGHRLDVAVNISAHDLACDAFVAKVERLLAWHGVDPGLVTLEVTETATMADPAAAAAVLGRLRRLGLSIAIDDFGTGYSSLAYLRDLAATSIKVDRSFVADLAGEAKGLDVLHSVVALAAPRGLTVVAEGIEDEPTYALLRDLGVQRGQGYLMARPMPAGELGAVLDGEALRQVG